MSSTHRLERTVHNNSHDAYLRIQDDSPSLINPQVLLYKAAILQRQQAVCEAHQTVLRLDGWHSGSRWWVECRSGRGVPALSIIWAILYIRSASLSKYLGRIGERIRSVLAAIPSMASAAPRTLLERALALRIIRTGHLPCLESESSTGGEACGFDPRAVL